MGSRCAANPSYGAPKLRAAPRGAGASAMKVNFQRATDEPKLATPLSHWMGAGATTIIGHPPFGGGVRVE